MSESRYKPLHNLVLLRTERAKTTAGGLHVPDAHQRVGRVVVLAVGPEVKHVQPGDEVMCTERAVTYIPDDEPEHAMVEEAAIIAVCTRPRSAPIMVPVSGLITGGAS
jgi:co-chaperonin GroES (HSP10)